MFLETFWIIFQNKENYSQVKFIFYIYHFLDDKVKYPCHKNVLIWI